MWIKIAGAILRYRVAFIVGVLICTGLMASQLGRIEMSYEYANLLPAKDKSYLEYTDFLERFGQEGNVMVFAIQDSNFYTLNKVNDWIALGDSIKSVHGIEALVSIAHTFNLQKNTEDKKFEVLPIFPHRIDNTQQLDSLANIAENLPFYNGTLINKESNTFNMLVTVSADVMASPDRVRLVKEVTALTDAFAEKHDLKMHYSGLPYIRVVNAESIKKEMYMFIVLSLLITALILYMFFRSWRIVGFSVAIIAISVIWSMGFMAILGFKITLLTAMLPPLLIVIGIPNCVFMVNKYHSEYVRHGNKIKALQRMVQKIGNATFLSNLTTASGFATFIVTSSQILKDFGMIAFISIVTVFIICLILIPAVFSFLPVPADKHTKHLENTLVNNFINRLINTVVYHRNKVYIVTLAVIAVGVVGISMMKTTGYMVDDLKETDPIRQDLQFYEDNFDGLMPLEVSVDFGKQQQVYNLRNLEKLEALSNAFEADPDISRPLSIVEAAKFANQAYYNGNARYYALPNSMTRNFIMRYIASSKEGMGGQINSFVDSTAQRARLSFRIKDIGTKRMEQKEQELIAKADSIFPSDKYDVKVTGSSIIFFKGNQYLIKNLFTSLALAVVLIAAFMSWMFKSKRMVLVALIPNIIPLIITAAIMGYFGIPIKASTILVFSIAFGISVDDTIHYLAKYRQELQITQWDIHKSVVMALRDAGQSMIYTSIILFFGFGIFCLSNFGGTFALGLLVSITLLAAMISNLVILPSLLLTLERMITNESFKEPLLQIYDEEEDIELEKLQVQEVGEE
ncbi:MAG: efflux RND transporter permease subunit [Marinifilaceae bacterium]